jgi:hypothetical protein
VSVEVAKESHIERRRRERIKREEKRGERKKGKEKNMSILSFLIYIVGNVLTKCLSKISKLLRKPNL